MADSLTLVSMAKEFAARRLDVQSFAEEAGSLSGQEPVRKHERLMAETQGRGPDEPVRWSATGELRNRGHVAPECWLHLKADAVLQLTCQRCLAPVDVPLAVRRSFRFVADEEAAAAQDEQSEEDVLAFSRSFDLIELVEDELLMEVPLVPRHAVCPAPVAMSATDPRVEASSGGERENSFAVLGRLRIGKSPDG